MKFFALILVLASGALCFSILSAGSQGGQEILTTPADHSGMGHVGTALGDSLNFSPLNPATLGRVTRTLFMLSYKQEYTSVTDAAGRSQREFSQNIPYLTTAFSLGRLGSAALAYVDHSCYDYQTVYAKQTLSYDTLKGIGTLYSLDITYSREILPFLCAGLSLNMFAGYDSILFVRDFFSAVRQPLLIQSEKSEIRAHTFTAGFLFTHQNLRLGFSLQNQQSVPLEQIKKEQIYYTRVLNRQDSVSVNRNYMIPAVFRIGAAQLMRSSQLILTGDFGVSLWNRLDKTLDNTYNLSLGSEFRPRPTQRPALLRRCLYRTGYHCSRLNHDDIVENALTLGVGIPVPHFTQLFNVSIEGGQRGLLSKNHVQERFLKIQFGIRASGRWGRRAEPASEH